MKGDYRQPLILLGFALLLAVGCDGEEEAVEEAEPAASVVDAAEPPSEPKGTDESQPAIDEDGGQADTDTMDTSVESDVPVAEVEDTVEALKTHKKKKAKLKNAFYGESGDLEGIPVATPIPWRRVMCDGENECVVNGDLTGPNAVQILSAVDGDGKLDLSIRGGTGWSRMELLGFFHERVQRLELKNLPGVNNIAAVGDLPLLKSLELSNLPQVTSIEAVGKLLKLTSLKMEGLGCVELEPLSKLRALEELNVSIRQRVCAVNVDALAGMGGLKRLILRTPNLGNIDSIGGAGALKELFLWGAVRDLSPLIKLPNLETLTLHASPVQDLSPLSALQNLKTLRLQAGFVWNYKGLVNARKLRHLHVSEAQTLILENVKVLRQLDGLTLHRGKPKDWAALEALPWLRHLDVSFTNFSDVGLLKKLPRLTSFGCAGCRLKGGAQFTELVNLEEINIAGTSGGPTMLQLGGMVNLKKLTIRRRQFGRTSLKRLIRQRPQLRLVYASGRFKALEE
jgi:hypothetical protein